MSSKDWNEMLALRFLFLISFFGAAIEVHAIVGAKPVDDDSPLARSTVEILSSGEKCTGSLINISEKLAVLTANHCIVDDRNKVEIHFKKLNLVVSTMLVKKNKISRHSTKDLALIRITNVPTGFRSAKMMAPTFIPQAGEIATIAGFGNISALQSSDGQLRSKEIAIERYYHGHQVSFLADKGGASCFGDSGGPAYLWNQNTPYLFGVSSYMEYGIPSATSPDGACNGISFYINIASEYDWLLENL